MEGGAEPEQDIAELPSDTEEKDRDKAKKAAVCEVCGAAFETRRGLSSHARSHLRQMGVCVSDSSGAPIALLYQLITERDGKLAFSFKPSPTSPSDPSDLAEPKKSPKKAPVKPKLKPKPGSVTKLKIKIGELVRRHKPPSTLDKTRPPALASPPTSPPVPPPVSSLALPPVSPVVLSKPQVTLPEPDSLTKVGVHRCELCGACYETRKGLASHARTHLRHLGVDLDSSASSIKVLHDLLQREAELLQQDSEDVLPVPVTPPPAKKKKTRRGSAQNDVSCEYCGEKFKTTQSLASHARCHLRHLGVTDWGGSPGATLKVLMVSRGCTSLPKPTQATPPTPAPIVPPTATPTEPPAPPPPLPLSPPAPDPAPVRVPKARKGSRLAVPRPKPEATEQNGSAETPKNKPAASANQSLNQSESNLIPANQIPTAVTVLQEEVGVSELVQCDYCSDVFDSRKALSCHARAHLRQLGVKWVQYASPIDTLQELMIREGRGQGSEDSAGVKSFTPSPVDFFREKTEASDGSTAASEATCELCGFDFENRKALASHARAHLRQLGEQWSSSQSPIDALSQWMSREPEKVAQLHLSYQQGALPHVRKRRGSAPVLSSDADSAHSAMSHLSTGRESKSSSQRKLSSHRPSPYTASDSAHSVRGFERRPPKLVPHSTARAEPLKRAGNAPSLVPPPPETSLVKLVGKIYSLRCRFCEQVFHGPLSVQEDWLIHLRHHILNPNPAPSLPSTDAPQLIGQVV